MYGVNVKNNGFKRLVWGFFACLTVFSFVLLYIPFVRNLVGFSAYGFIYWYIGIIVLLMLYEFMYIYFPTKLGGTRE